MTWLGLGLGLVANHFDVVPVRTNDESCVVVRYLCLQRGSLPENTAGVQPRFRGTIPCPKTFRKNYMSDKIGCPVSTLTCSMSDLNGVHTMRHTPLTANPPS